MTTATLIGLLAAAFAVPASAAPTALEDQIHAIIGASNGLDGPGCAIGVLQAGKAPLIVADGAADIAAKRPIDADTQIYTASVAKQFTALAIAQLVAAGKIGLDDDIRKYLPEMPRYQVPVTVGMLLHHTSGIRDMLELGGYAGYATSASVDRTDALKLVMAQSDTIFVPGTQHRYSNSGYFLLSEIVARVSGLSFADYMTRHVFAPMGMKRTMVLNGARSKDPNSAHGYAPDSKGFKLADTHPLYGGAGGAVITINDLARYDHDINVGHVVWTPAVTKIMLAPGRLSDGKPAASDGAVYAGGLTLDGPWIKHGGAGEGFKNMVAWLPEGRLAIHILCNNGAVIPSKMADRVVAAIGGYPAIYAATTAFAGRYATDDLPVFYVLKPVGADRLSVSIEPKPGALGDRRVLELAKSGDGAYQGKSFKIVMDNDRRGFVLGDDRSRVGTFHFSRVD